MSKKKNKNKKTVNKLVLAIFLLIFIVFLDVLIFKITETGVFTVYNYTTNEEIKTYKHFMFAKKVMEKEESDTICIKNESDKIVALKYGVVNMKQKNDSKEIEYEAENGKKGSLDVSMVADAVYLKTSNSGKRVQLYLSGAKIWVNTSDVDIYTLESSPYVSYYEKIDDAISHHVSQNVTEDQSVSYAIGFVPEYMQDGIHYYSYDGNYFYLDYKTMNKDIIKGTHKNALNNKDGYYAFYQYIPHRTYSTISMDTMNRYLSDIHGITDVASYLPCDPDQSVLYNLGDHIIGTQNTYGVNAAMMFCLALSESSVGQSESAIRDHNLFQHEVYENTVDRENSYSTFDECLIQHAKYYIQNNYSNPDSDIYKGSWFGNFKSGINAMYSSDPYWGERIASIYRQLDLLNGYSDYYSIPIKTFKTKNNLIVYGTNKGKNKLYEYNSGDIVSFQIKNIETYENDNYYEIYSEVPIENKKKNLEINYSQECNGYILNN